MDNWLYRYVGGIQINEKEILINPMPLEQVNYVCVEHGGIKVERRGHRLRVELPVPAKIIWNGNTYDAAAGEHCYEH